MPEQKEKQIKPSATYRVFVSSTYVDMKKYRDAMSNALLRAGCLPVGMEWFGASAIPPLDSCFEEIESCQIYICALGMRYGEVDSSTQKSYTQIEFEKAEALGIPMLVFLVDEERTTFKAADIETGDGAKKLELFKEKIKQSKAVTFSYYSSPSELETEVLQAITKVIAHFSKPNAEQQSYIEGAKLFRRFVTRPATYQDTEAILRVRFDGQYGGWRLRDEVAKAFGFEPGTFLFLNDVFTLGIKPSVEHEIWCVDCFASDKAADWLEDNDVDQGTIFEGRFKFVYKTVENGAGIRGVNKAVDAKIANLILLEGVSVISRDVAVGQKPNESPGFEKIFPFDFSTSNN